MRTFFSPPPHRYEYNSIFSKRCGKFLRPSLHVKKNSSARALRRNCRESYSSAKCCERARGKAEKPSRKVREKGKHFLPPEAKFDPPLNKKRNRGRAGSKYSSLNLCVVSYILLATTGREGGCVIETLRSVALLKLIDIVTRGAGGAPPRAMVVITEVVHPRSLDFS